MIPVLGIAVYNRADLLERCLQSIDYPIGRILVVNNGQVDLGLVRLRYEFLVEEARGVNLGVAGAWNWIQDLTFNLQYEACLICGNDIEWAPGDLERVWQTHLEFPEAEFVFGNWSYSNFMVLRSGWQKIGAFDENFELAYLEDGDHWQRVLRTPAKVLHAAGLNAKHEGSATINSDHVYRRRVQAQQERNWSYYARKWGCPEFSHAKETFTTPFNAGSDVNAWQLEGERLKRPHFFSQWPPQ